MSVLDWAAGMELPATENAAGVTGSRAAVEGHLVYGR
jgi:hypothetical protein